MAGRPVTSDLAGLEAMSLGDLREHWALVTQRPVPRVSRAMLALALAYELQAAQSGGLSRQTRQKLDQLAAGLTRTRDAAPGMRLMREWNGTLHVVTIDEDGRVVWNGRSWKSLSEVARTITGTRWSGPAFFGLKQASSKAVGFKPARKAAA